MFDEALGATCEPYGYVPALALFTKAVARIWASVSSQAAFSGER